MENLRPSKCSMWHTTTPSSSQLSFSQDPTQYQIFNAGYHSHSTAVRAKPTSSTHKMLPEREAPWTPNISSNNLGHGEIGSSLLSLLSGHPCVGHAEVRSNNGSGNEVSLSSIGILSQNLDSQNVGAGADLCSVVSSKARVSASCGNHSGLNNMPQDAYLNVPKLELPKMGIHQNLSGNENGRLLPSFGVGYVNGSNPSNSQKLHYGHGFGASQKVPPKSDPSVSCSSFSLAKGCPRVFCLGLSGNLLLSNTGLLGVICSCHGLHMSITKFSEHSGLCNMNPGDAVRMESGETIAQWRKFYFHQFGVRIPEDHRGWDWPDGLSVTAGSVKHGPSVPSMSRNADVCNQGGPFGASVQSFNNFIFPKTFQTGQKVLSQLPANEKQGNTREGFMSSSSNNLHYVADNQMKYLISESPITPSLVDLKGQGHTYQGTLSYIDPISKSGNSFVSHPHLQNLKNLSKDIDTARDYGSFVNRDKVSSNVELRLGQPSQQSRSSGSSLLPAFGSHLIGTHWQPPKSLFSEQHEHKGGSSKSIEENRQHAYLADCMSDSSRRTKQGQSDRVCHASGVLSGMPNASQIEQLKGDAARGSVIAMSFAHVKSPLEEKFHSKSINDVICGSHVISKLHSESPVAKFHQFGFPLFGSEATDREFKISVPHTQKYGISEGAQYGIGGLHDAAELGFGSHTKSKGRMWSVGGAASCSDPQNFAASQNKSPNLCWLSGMMDEGPDTVNPFNHSAQAPYPAQNVELDSNISRSISLPMDMGTIFSSQAVSMGFSVTNPTILGLTPLARKENTDESRYVLNEDVKVLALQHASEFPNQKHATTLLKAIPEQERSRNSCGISQVLNSSSAHGQRVNGFNSANVLNTSEVATQSLQSDNLMFCHNEYLGYFADSEKLRNYTALSQERYFNGKDSEMQGRFASPMQSTGQIFLRLGSTEGITPPSHSGKCTEQLSYGCFSSKCSCPVHASCLTGRCDQKGETTLGEFKEREGCPVGLVATLLGSKLDENYTILEKVKSFGKNENTGQNIEKAECNSFQWRDVPKKVIGTCNLTCDEKSANPLNGNIEGKVTDPAEAAVKCFDKSAHNPGSLKEREMSNISSGSSAPVITQASIEIDNKNSSTIDAEDAMDNNFVVDEGSRIERCWSSDDGVDSERGAEYFGFASKVNLVDDRPSKSSLGKQSRSLIDELRFRDTLRLRNTKNQIHTGHPIQENRILMQKSVKESKIAIRRPVKWKKLDASFPPSTPSSAHNGTSECAGDSGLHSSSSKHMAMLPQCDQGSLNGCPCSIGRSFKRRKSALSSSATVSQRRDVHLIHHIEEEKGSVEDNLNDENDYGAAFEAIGRKRLRSGGATEASKQFYVNKSTCIDSVITGEIPSINCNTTVAQLASVSRGIQKPIVYGKFGVISNANSSKPVKFVSLRKLLKAPSKCRSDKSDTVDIHQVVSGELSPEHSVEEVKTVNSFGSKECNNKLSHLMKKRRNYGIISRDIPDSHQSIQLQRKYKEVRKRSLHELTSEEHYSSSLKFPIANNRKSLQEPKSRFLHKLAEKAEDDKTSVNTCNAKKSTKEKIFQHTWNLDVFCCVCGCSNKDEHNCILECFRCSIRVHQACYGITKAPKTRWYCRPCKTSTKNIVCVLCGYGGGAMTRALCYRNIVKSLLQAWNVGTGFNPENHSSSKHMENLVEKLAPSNAVSESDPFLVIRPANVGLRSEALWNGELSENRDAVGIMSSPPHAPLVCNSITAGLLDSTIKQWVHVVCGLWTPGTRCPNVDTMSAFDVSGACQPKQDVICSICERPGGSCIQCRVIDCFGQFHPWCAHQKGLLQSEVEGIDNENLGFYGRCLVHATNNQFDSDNYRIGCGNANCQEMELTCARTEGYKGRKRDGFHYNLLNHSNGSGGCLVPEEQLNAWIHINGQKLCKRGPIKLSTSEIEYDCRKEYARYKQSRGWQHLVVYKSGIHGLGLYTSQFISRGAMVVEYVGEIVGLRVADKRETEYQSGKKLQYKSACYFFRIDKEYIIDATCMGGIARFVNHSCLPNCVAKVISVRNEKKVVFFAERDIYPGEEVTYDYHFNHEDEGKKLPCYCNSKNCRRYLN